MTGKKCVVIIIAPGGRAECVGTVVYTRMRAPRHSSSARGTYGINPRLILSAQNSPGTPRPRSSAPRALFQRYIPQALLMPFYYYGFLYYCLYFLFTLFFFFSFIRSFAQSRNVCSIRSNAVSCELLCTIVR